MANSVPKPKSQKASERPIGFFLDDRRSSGDTYTADLVIRPEDLVRTDPSRMSVQQTLGGAWADNFGAGIPTINISGHTGWRRRLGANDERDGGERFKYLFEVVFTKWHLLRTSAIRSGEDPDDVRLIFVDALDDFAAVVAPTSFVLRRSRSRPLLSQYQISMMVLTLNIDAPKLDLGLGPTSKREKEMAGLDSLTESIKKLTEYAKDINKYIDKNLVAPARDFLQKTARLYGSVVEAVATVDDIAGSLVSVARMTAQAGVNIFRAMGAVANLPSQVTGRLMQVASAYSNILCVLRNAIRQQEFYDDYSPLFGSANCSSTSGGRPLSPLSGVNPFYLYSPANRELPVTLTENAQTSLMSLASSDVVLAPMSTGSLGGALTQVSNGMAVA